MTGRPEWLKIRHTNSPNLKIVETLLESLNLNTVCREAVCPNYLECFSSKTATFMILGTNCTRNCSFCNVRNGNPQNIDYDEPSNIALAVEKLELEYVVITSVTRDDLPDGGAGQFERVIKAIQASSPNTAIEVLIPDLKGCLDSLEIITNANPAVISHNMETVRALYSKIRPQASYKRSLEVLNNIKKRNPNIHSKSGIMLGFGEVKEQVFELFNDLRDVDCEFLTIGQYLAPTKKHFPIYEYVEPNVFDAYAKVAKELGFRFVASAPLVRSSYHAKNAVLR